MVVKKKKIKGSAVGGGFLSSEYEPPCGRKDGGTKKKCPCKRNITFIISCQFQTGLRIRDLSSVFVLS